MKGAAWRAWCVVTIATNSLRAFASELPLTPALSPQGEGASS